MAVRAWQLYVYDVALPGLSALLMIVAVEACGPELLRGLHQRSPRSSRSSDDIIQGDQTGSIQFPRLRRFPRPGPAMQTLAASDLRSPTLRQEVPISCSPWPKALEYRSKHLSSLKTACQALPFPSTMAGARRSRRKAEPSSGFDLLPGDVLDIITEKVRREWYLPESFRALECTSKGCLESVRRCSKTLVIKPLEEIEQAKQGALERSSNAKMTPSERPSEELGKRSGVTKLVIKEPNFVSRGRKLSLSEALSTVNWVSCIITGHSCLRSTPRRKRKNVRPPVAWHLSFGERALSASGASLRELSMIRYDVEGSTLLQLAKSFPQVTFFKVEGYVYGSRSLVDFSQLATLDISELWPARRQVPGPGPIVPAPNPPAWPPNVRYLQEGAHCDEGPISSIQLLGLTADWRTLPSSLEVLELSWKMSIKKFGRRLLLVRFCPSQTARRFGGSRCASSLYRGP